MKRETTKLVMLVEDNPNDEALAVRALKKVVDGPIVVARDGAEALDLLFLPATEAPRTPDMVLLDLHLPKIGGQEVLRRIRSDPRTRLLPVVILTSSGDPGDLDHCYDLGANRCAIKPVDSEAYVELVRQIAAYWLFFEEAAPRSDEP